MRLMHVGPACGRPWLASGRLVRTLLAGPAGPGPRGRGCQAVRPRRTQQATPPPEEPAELGLEEGGLPPEELLAQLRAEAEAGEGDGAWGSDEEEEEGAGAAVYYVGEEEEEELLRGGEGDEEGGPAAGRAGGRKRLPAEVRCFDTARIYVKGGDGGKGCVAFRREKFVPKGGPSGGNGGRGGHVYCEGDAALNSLTAFRRQVHFRAEPGTPGGGSDMHGAAGPDLVVRVPPGTIVRRKGAAPGEPPLAEVLRPGQRVLLAAGGRGGRGNLAFKTARNTAPALAELGERGQELWVDLELRLVADVGIIGVPNAGKSTLLSVLSAARPKVAPYPFTTLVPNLGVCSLDYRTTVFADVPGLLEGAHAGVGLGHQFLRHVQRCRVLVHLVDGTSPDPMGDYRAIRAELELFNPDLAHKPQVVGYNKVDVPDSSDYWEDMRDQLAAEGVAREDIVAVSAATGRGVPELVRRVRAVLDALPEEEAAAAAGEGGGAALPGLGRDRLELEPHTAGAGAGGAADGGHAHGALAERARRGEARIGEFSVESDLRGPRLWFVKGEALERFAQMTDWSYYEAARRFQRVLDAAGVSAALRAAGIQEGDTVVIGELEYEYSADTSEGAAYARWAAERKAAGVVGRGQARWPHMTG